MDHRFISIERIYEFVLLYGMTCHINNFQKIEMDN